MRYILSALLVSAALLTGCAGTAPKATFVAPPPKDARVRTSDTVKVTVAAGTGVEMLDSERTRLGEVIAQKVEQYKTMLPAAGAASAYDLEVTVTRFEKGNAFARAMLAGLGQIHLDARVRLLDAASQSQVSAFDLKKTFAWGGMYGATTGIEDVEPAFAEGIAAALTGLEEAKK